MPNPTTLIIGKSGKTGQRLNTLLQQAGHQTRAVSRSTIPAFDWHQPDHWLDIMRGCQSAYITYQPDLALPQAKVAIAQFIKVAKQAGVEHLVLLSGRGEEGAQQAEQLLINSGLRWNILRASWFAQNFSEGYLTQGIIRGQLAMPAGDVPEPFIDIDDIADMAFTCLTQPGHSNQLFEVTGPELLSFRSCVAIIAQELQSHIEFIPVTVAAFLHNLKQQGAPSEKLWLMEVLFTEVMDGRNSQISNDTEKLLGRPAGTFRDYVKKTQPSGVWDALQAVTTAQRKVS